MTSGVKDAEARTLTVTARFAAPIGRVWEVWSDPRQLERWWGPPLYPATVLEHDLAPGGTVTYVMTGPDGNRYGGRWHMRTVDPPHRLEFGAVFADPDGNPVTQIQSRPHERSRSPLRARPVNSRVRGG